MSSSTPPAPNVLFVVMDTSRLQNTLPTVNPGELPNLARIADDGTLFEEATTTAPWTLPSHAALFSGQRTADHGTHGGTQYFDPDGDPLAARLRAAGYHTAAVSNNTWVTPEFGFDAGFDDFHVRSRPFPTGEDPAVARRRLLADPIGAAADLLGGSGTLATAGNLLYDRLLRGRHDDGARLANWRIGRWLSSSWDGDRPFFLFANYIEPHLPYTPPEEYLPAGFDPDSLDALEQDPWAYLMGEIEITDAGFAALEALYQAELRYLDAMIGEVYDLLDAEGLLDETLVVVVGDHGENIGDHGLMDHQFSLHDTLLRVPLLIRPPGGSSVERVSSPVETRDLFPTVLDYAGVDAPTEPTVSDRSLRDALAGRADPDDARAYTLSEYVTPRPSVATLEERFPDSTVDLDRYDRSLRCIRTPEWKYVQATDGCDWLFDVADDPGETTDLADERPAVRARLRRTLVDELGPFDRTAAPEREPDRHEPNPETESRLDSLGYI